MATARNNRSNPTKKLAVKESDVAANEAILAHAEFSRTVKSWLSIPASGDGSGDDDKEQQASDNGGAGGTTSSRQAAAAAGEEGTSDMGGLGYIPPKDSNGRPVTATANSDPTTAFLRKQLLGNRSRRAPPPTARSRGGSSMHGAANHHAAARGPGKRTLHTNEDDSEDGEDSRSNARKAPSTSTRARAAKSDSVVEMDLDLGDDGKLQTGAQVQQTEQQAPDKSPYLDGPPEKLKRGPTSYLDEVLAERARKKHKRQNKKGS